MCAVDKMSTDFIIQQLLFYAFPVILIFYNFSKCSIKAPWRWCRGTKTCRSNCNI